MSSSSQKRELTPKYVEDSDDDRPSKKLQVEHEQDPHVKKNGDGEAYFDLSSKRRVTVRKFKGKVLVDIREYYESDSGSLAPGKKGISLSEEQWDILKGLAGGIDREINAMKK